MQLVTIEQMNHEVLRHPAREIVFPLNADVMQFIQELKHYFDNLKSPFGKPAGLAATQVGKALRIIIIQVPPEARQIRKDVYDTLPPTVLINPSYAPVDESKNKDWEGCYSVPGLMGEVYRYTEIEYQAYREDGMLITGTARGFLARLIQHEVGHLNGELYVDLFQSDCRRGNFDDMMKIRLSESKQG
ncbi:Peptide deformylase [Aquicella siphonis]|uniref:Peptide deformylase n=1 Tax=Aquicella siphonis TaxID=254247 RepID=A0A5E4PFK9_9COXI|nr:peptide deformylase [Aquicella siphonis]VVC75770.1 Peptide deformylase [Aquicella siphonis]